MNDNFDSRLRALEAVSHRGTARPAVVQIIQPGGPTAEQRLAVAAAQRAGRPVITVRCVDMRKPQAAA